MSSDIVAETAKLVKRRTTSNDENGDEADTFNPPAQHSNEDNEMPRLPNVFETWIRPALAEFFGQLIFAFLHCSTANTNNSFGLPTSSNALLQASSDGLTVAILIISIGKISGCHVNFAVTTAVSLGGGIKLVLVPVYLIAQLLGSLSGAGLALAINGGSYGQFSLGPNVSVGNGLLMEVLLSCFLTLAVLLAAVEFKSDLAALAIGFIIWIDIMAGFNISGGCMNPTLSFGPAVVSGVWKDYWIYWAGPLLGACLSAIIFRFVLGDKSRLFLKSISNQRTMSDDVNMEKGTSSQSNSRT